MPGRTVPPHSCRAGPGSGAEANSCRDPLLPFSRLGASAGERAVAPPRNSLEHRRHRALRQPTRRGARIEGTPKRTGSGTRCCSATTRTSISRISPPCSSGMCWGSRTGARCCARQRWPPDPAPRSPACVRRVPGRSALGPHGAARRNTSPTQRTTRRVYSTPSIR